MKKLSLNYFFAMAAVASVGFLSSCTKDAVTPTILAPAFDESLSNTGVVLNSQYASSGNGSFYSSKTKSVSNSAGTASAPANVDITYADLAVSGTAADQPTIISPDYRATVSQTGAKGPISNINGAGSTYFKSTALDLGTATAKQVSDEIASIGTAKSIAVTGVNNNYIFINSTAGTKGIIKITELQSVATSTAGENTTNIKFDIKVLK